MKNARIIIFLISLFHFSSVEAQNKYALLIGISTYPNNQSKNQLWSNLKSDNDIELLQKTLPKHGFSADNIFTLLNERVTPSGIGEAIDDLCQKLNNGDVVILHFSGHGQQITDLDGAEYDLLDEAFVCYNAPTEYYNGYKGEDHLSDDEINILISKIRKKLGSTGHLLVLFDSCHSGNMSRGGGNLNARGGEGKIVFPDSVVKALAIEKQPLGSSDWISSQEDESNLASYCAISGCLPSELNYQVFDKSNTEYGSLTYAFCEVMRQPGVEKMNYQDVSLRIKQIIQNKVSENNNSQHPTVEGNLSTLFLSGQALGIKPYFEIFSINKDIVTVSAGLLSSLNLGDSLCFKNIKGQIIDKGRIESIDATQCQVKLKKIKSSSKTIESNYTAELWSRNMTVDFIKTYIKGSSKRHISLIKDSISNLYGFELVEDSLAAKLIIEVRKDKSISCYTRMSPTNFIRKIQNQPIEALTAIKKELESYFIIERFSSLEINSNLNASLAFRRFSPKVAIPTKDDTIKIESIDHIFYFTHSLNWEAGVIGKMKAKDLLQVELYSPKLIHVKMINIVNGEITNKNLKSEPVKPSSLKTIWSTVDPGDLYKVIISDKPFDLSNAPAVIQGKSKLPASRGEIDVTEFLFPKTKNSRGGDQEFSIYNFNVEIE